MTITESEILDALRAAVARPDSPDDALTTREMMEATGWSEKKVQNHVRRMIADGTAAPVQVRRVNLCGVLAVTWGYRLTGKAA